MFEKGERIMLKKDIFSLQGMNAIITGGGRGIGKSLAEGYLEYGAKVVITGSSDAIFDTQKELREKGYDITAVKMQLLDREQRKKAFEECLDALNGKLDIFYNNAGLQKRIPIEEWPMEEWDKVMEINLNSLFDLSRLAVTAMKPNKYGKIINMGSIGGLYCTAPNVPAYAATKAAVHQLTKNFACEFGPFGIRTNAIAPGFTLTDLSREHLKNPAMMQVIHEQVPLGDWGQVEDIQGLAILLASHAGDYINGETIVIDGGYCAR